MDEALLERQREAYAVADAADEGQTGEPAATRKRKPQRAENEQVSRLAEMRREHTMVLILSGWRCRQEDQVRAGAGRAEEHGRLRDEPASGRDDRRGAECLLEMRRHRRGDRSGSATDQALHGRAGPLQRRRLDRLLSSRICDAGDADARRYRLSVRRVWHERQDEGPGGRFLLQKPASGAGQVERQGQEEDYQKDSKIEQVSLSFRCDPARRNTKKAFLISMDSKLADWDDDDPSTMQDLSARWDKVVILKHMFTLTELEVRPKFSGSPTTS